MRGNNWIIAVSVVLKTGQLIRAIYMGRKQLADDTYHKRPTIYNK
ncbi:hypothetical protein [Simiaoa sunii]|jgi:hypothetical protein|nr:hypothetical protein [Simiaoa sunii]